MFFKKQMGILGGTHCLAQRYRWWGTGSIAGPPPCPVDPDRLGSTGADAYGDCTANTLPTATPFTEQTIYGSLPVPFPFAFHVPLVPQRPPESATGTLMANPLAVLPMAPPSNVRDALVAVALQVIPSPRQ